MDRQGPELANVFRRHGQAYLERGGVPHEHRRVMRDIALCRTAALGGHLEQCAQCGREHPVYNPCSNRHCPKCGSRARADWLQARKAELIDAPYFHVVFTLPDRIAAIALQNKRTVYAILFRAASETLLQIAADSKHLGARIGFFAVLHTWGQNLLHHPHLHCVVPGGGLSPGGSRWIPCRPGFFLPVRVLSRRFRNLFLQYLGEAFDAGKLHFAGSIEQLADRGEWIKHIDPLRSEEWVVYAKPPFAGPERVLEYAGRYTHRVAISNHRIREVGNQTVSFQWRDYRDDNREKIMTLDAGEFIRRFLLHVLPGGFQRIRHFGFLANRNRRHNLELIRRLLAMPESIPPESSAAGVGADAPRRCPFCRKGTMIPFRALDPEFRPYLFQDSS